MDKGAYKLAKGRSKRVVAKVQEEERQIYCDMLEEEDGKGNVFRVAKQMVGLNKDITASGCVKGGGWENYSSGRKDIAKMERILWATTK